MIILVLGVLLCYVHIFVESCACVVLFGPVCAGIMYNVMCKLSRYWDCSSCYKW
jgi:hypothetical protein